MRLDRRAFVRCAALGLPALLAWPLRAEANRFTLAHLRHGDGWAPRPTALRRLLWEIGKRTSIEVEADAVALDPCDRRLFTLPLAYLAVDGALPPFSECARSALRTYLTFGGTVVVDGVEGGRDSAFARSARRAFDEVTAAPWQAVPRDHVLYKSFYLLDGAAGRSAASPDLEAKEVDGRLAIILCHNDLGGAWARSNLGLWEHEVVPGGNQQRERAFRLGVNLVMYALCTDYKEDQVHIPFILKKRRR